MIPPVLYGLAFEYHAAAWGLALLLLAAGFGLAVLFVGPGPRRLPRALLAAGPAMLVLPVVLLLPRLVQIIHPGIGGGPQRWLLAPLHMLLPDGWYAPGTFFGALTDGAPPLVLHAYDTAVLLHLGAAALLGLAWPAAALIDRFRPWRPPSSGGPVPLATPVAVGLGVVALALPWLAHRALPLSVEIPALEWAAIAPVVALMLAVRMFGERPEPEERIAHSEADEIDTHTPDVRRAWVAAGVLDAEAEPQVQLPGERRPTLPEGEASPAAERAWHASGRTGAPPGALDVLFQSEEAATWLVGDLPPHAEKAVTDAFLADRVGTGGHRVLAIVPDPESAAERLRMALERVHTWTPGHIVAGAPALREALARDRLPAVTFVTPAELAREVVPFTARDGRAWAGALTWMVLHRPDAGGPREVTHTAFTFKRWALATAGLAPPSTLVTGPDTPAVLNFLEGLLPGRPVRRCPVQLRDPGRVTVWPALADTSSAADPWTVRAARAVTDLGLDVDVADVGGRLDRLAHQDPRIHVARRVDVRGAASVAELEGAALAEAWRSAHHRIAADGNGSHQALWHVRPSPVGHFLASPGRMSALHERRELPVPRPVVGTHNRFLRLAHLRAALEDAHADERALRKTFGDDVVDFVLRDAERTGAWVSRVEQGRIVRAPVLRGPRGVDAPDPSRQALTSQVTDVVEDRTGEILARVDQLVAATRYHPKRVVAVGPRRYRVPLHALDEKRRQLRVVPADPKDAPTRPLLRFSLEPRSTLVDQVHRRQEGIEVTTMTVSALVTEEVYGAWVPGVDQRETFDPVRSKYDTEVRLVLPHTAEPGRALGHLAGLLGTLLPAHLRIAADDAEVIAVGAGVGDGTGPGLAVIDRHVGGLGIARTLDDGTVVELLRWVRAVLYACDCTDGCPRCTPEAVLRLGPDKQGVLRMLPVDR